MDFTNMTNKDIRKLIRDKEDEQHRLLARSNASEDVAEVRSIGVKLDECNKVIKEAKDELDNRQDEQRNDSGFNPALTFRGGSYSMNYGKTETAVPVEVDKLALRNDETLVSRLGLKNNLDLGKFVRGMVTGNWENAEAERRSYTTTATGVLIPQELSAQIIDAARNVSLFTSAGVPIVPMTSGNLTIAKVKKDPTFKFKKEGEAADESTDFELDSVDLKAKTIYGYSYVSLEAIESAKNLTDIIMQAFSQSMANGVDLGLLYGQYNSSTSEYDEFAPAGIMNDANVNTITATNEAYNDFIKAVGAVRRANGNPTAMGINAETDELINLLRDNNGNYLEVPKVIADLQKIVSNQLKSDATDGNDALVFDPQAMVIGVQNDIRVNIITNSDECVKKGLVCFQLYSMVDGATTRPTHITKITGIKEKVMG